MPAPLYNRWRRSFDKLFKKSDQVGNYLKYKNKIQVYSISDNASRLLGQESYKSDAEWFDILSHPPHEAFFVEFSWRKYHESLKHTPADDFDRPTRCAFIFIPSPEGWHSLYLLLYPNGSFMLSPGVLSYSKEPHGRESHISLMGLGHPESKVTDHLSLELNDELLKFKYDILVEFAGIARQCLSAYAAVCMAKLPSFRPAPSDAPHRERRAIREPIEINETNLYLSNRTIRGETHLTPSESTHSPKSRHEVRGHWCYRHGRDNPLECIVSSHDWEGDQKRQTCLHCGQKRWFRPAHERGEGELVSKVRNIRL